MKMLRMGGGTLLLLGLLPQTAPAEEVTVLPDTRVTASRLGEGIGGASTTVITADEIARSPGESLADILGGQPGIQVQSLYGGVNGTNSTVDMRGFGAAGTPNTLVLVDGRRLNDIDLSGIDFGAIQKAGIERIEITRGNSGAVLYGDGAVGGVINIVTKNGFNEPPSLAAEAAFGSFGYVEGNASASRAFGGTAVSLFANAIKSDGYRDNNELRQKNAEGEVRQAIDGGELYLKLSGDTQHLGLPGARLVGPYVNEMVADRTGTDTPNDFGDKQGVNAAFGGTRTLSPGIDLIVDAGIRHKDQQSGFFSAWGAAYDSYADTSLTTLSLTPRVTADHHLFSLAGKLTGGIDLYQSYYDSDRSVEKDDPVAHRYKAQQRTLSGYVQEALALAADTDLTAGGRVENADIVIRDRFDPSAPNPGTPVAGTPLDKNQTSTAFHLGLEHRLTSVFTLFGRVGQAMRLPTIDERINQSPWGVTTNFNLKTQVSRDVEVGTRGKWAGLSFETSAYVMELKDELHYNPYTYTNLNLDPTRRIGVEHAMRYPLTDALSLKGSFAYTQAEFRSGPWKGNEVPLVSPWTGNAGVSWDILGKRLTLDADVHYVGERRFDNDQANGQPQIPDHTLVDLKVGGEVEKVHWSIAVQNLFDQKYFDYGIVSTTTSGSYNAYPMPGLNAIGRIGVKF